MVGKPSFFFTLILRVWVTQSSLPSSILAHFLHLGFLFVRWCFLTTPEATSAVPKGIPAQQFKGNLSLPFCVSMKNGRGGQRAR